MSFLRKSRFRAEIAKITDFHRKRDQIETGLLHRFEVQKWSPRVQLFDNQISVAGRNFWRQHFGQILAKIVAVATLGQHVLPVEISTTKI